MLVRATSSGQVLFSPQIPPRSRNGFYWADVLFNGSDKGLYTFNIRAGAGIDDSRLFVVESG
jgi:hypothetical protein